MELKKGQALLFILNGNLLGLSIGSQVMIISWFINNIVSSAYTWTQFTRSHLYSIIKMNSCEAVILDIHRYQGTHAS